MRTPREKILSVGLTGGIACGRTTVCGLFSREGARIIDMDEIAHQLMEPGGGAVDAVVSAFGEKVRTPAAGINRSELGKKVFADRAARGLLESILHPMILIAAEKIIEEFTASAKKGVVITDAALLVETGGYRRYQRLVVVACDPQVQLHRLMQRDHLDETDARARIDAQAPLSEKVPLADYLIDTSGSHASTEARASEVYAMLLDDCDRLPVLLPRNRS